MVLNGVVIKGRDTLHEHFSYPELHKKLREELPEMHSYQQMKAQISMDGERDVDVFAGYILKFLSGKECEESKKVSVVLKAGCWTEEQMKGYLEMICQNDLADSEVRDFFDDFWLSANPFLTKITRDWKRTFSVKGIAEMWLFLLLHIQAECEIEAEGEEYLQCLLNDLDFQEGFSQWGKEAEIYVPSGEKALKLPFYQGETDADFPLEIVKMINPTEELVQITLGDTILERSLAPASNCYLLRKGEEFVDFLPSFTLLEDVLFHSTDKGLKMARQGKTRLISSEAEPVVWTHMNRYGTCMVHRDGTYDKEKLRGIRIPGKNIVSVTSYAEEYCFLFEDGSISANSNYIDWNHLLTIFVGKEQSMAIDGKRRPLLKNGVILEGPPAVKGCCYENHYIWMDIHGGIHTDAGLEELESGKITAIAIGSEGYVIATQKTLKIYSFEKELKQNIPVPCDITELAASGKQIAYYDSWSEDYKVLTAGRNEGSDNDGKVNHN